MQNFIEPHNPDWKHEFERLKAAYLRSISYPFPDIQHVGSTSVPGLVAKPILDIDIIIQDKKAIHPVTKELKQLGYIEKGEQGIPGRFAFRQSSPLTPETNPTRQWMNHHLYVCYPDSLALKNHLLFRDMLIANKELSEKYSALKLTLTQNAAISREAYTIAKTDFITGVLAFAGLGKEELNKIRDANK